MPLTDLDLRNAKPRDKDYKLSDSGGLYLLVKKNGTRVWRQKYRFRGVEKLLSHGPYPLVGLAAARKLRDSAKLALQEGRDPGAEKQIAKKADGNTFEAWALAWHANRKEGWVPAHAERVLSRLKNDAIREFGKRGLREITRQDVLALLREVEERGAILIAKRLRGHISDIYDYAIAAGAADQNPAAEIGRKVLKPAPRVKHMTMLPVKALPKFFTDLETFGSERTRLAITLTILTWVRTNEMRFAHSAEFEFDGAIPLWRIPKERMKMDREHLVPLSPPAVSIAKRLIEIAGGNGPLFGEDGMSNTTMLQALYTIGYKGKATMHGFRRMASTWANDALQHNGDRKYHEDWVEMQLAHNEGDEVRSAYNAAEYLAPRRRMMNDWGAFIESQREVADDFDALLA